MEACLAPQTDTISCGVLMCEVVAVYQTVDTKLHGPVQCPQISKLVAVEKGNCEKIVQNAISIEIGGLFRGSANCGVKTFKEFQELSYNLSEAELRFWFSRMKLRFSCASVTTAFVRIIVPMLIEQGVEYLALEDRKITIRGLDILAIFFVPKQRYELSLQNIASEVIEGPYEFCSHNVVIASSGEILDFSGGQFTGVMLPSVFRDVEAYKSSIQGEVVHVRPCHDLEIQDQGKRDDTNAKKFGVEAPVVWCKRVTLKGHLNMTQSAFCWACLGTPSVSFELKRCMRCKTAVYCGKACQQHDWRRHKKKCIILHA